MRAGDPAGDHTTVLKKDKVLNSIHSVENLKKIQKCSKR